MGKHPGNKNDKARVAQSCPTLCDLMDYTVYRILQARILERVAFPFSGDLPNPGIEPRSPASQVILYQLSHQGSPRILEWVGYSFSRGSSRPRDLTRVSCIAGGFFFFFLPTELSGKPINYTSIKINKFFKIGKSKNEGHNSIYLTISKYIV